MSDLGSGQTTLETLFTNRAFRVPPYQRHYAWESRQLTEFIDDLSNVSDGKSHFFGTFLFMRPTTEMASTSRSNDADVGGGPYKVFDIVDGQQRMTTAVLLISAVNSVRPELLRPMQIRNFLYDKEEAAFKFQTVPEDWPFLRALIGGDSDIPQTQTPSQERLKDAYKFLKTTVSQQDVAQVEKWIKSLGACLILVHAVNGYGEASVIFETVNDRGKRLTDLEALKSFLMRIVDMTKQSDVAERQAIEALQGNFAAVYRMLNRFERGISEDNALRQCYLVFPRIWSDGSTSFWDGNGSARDDAKRWLLSLVHDGKRDVAFRAAHLLSQHIQTSFQKIEAVINNVSRSEEIEQLLTLRRIAGFWPIILKTYAGKDDALEEKKFRSILRLCEIASLKIWGIADYRVDKAQSELIRLAQQDGNDRGKVTSRLKEILKWWDIPARWREGLLRDTFYYQGRDARYVLFEYENFLRSKKGYTKVPYSDFDQMTIEHIAARKGQENVEKFLLEISTPDTIHTVAERVGGDGKSAMTTTNLLHHVGNLVIDPQPTNSGKNNLAVVRKLSWFNAAPYLSQIELEQYLLTNKLVWDATVIQDRGRVLVEFAMDRWDEDRVDEFGYV